MKFISLIKAFFQGTTKILYIGFSVLSLSVVLIEIIGSGGISDKGVVIIAFWGVILAFIFWVSHTWIKNTQYVGLYIVLVSLLCVGLYFGGYLKFS